VGSVVGQGVWCLAVLVPGLLLQLLDDCCLVKWGVASRGLRLRRFGVWFGPSPAQADGGSSKERGR